MAEVRLTRPSVHIRRATEGDQESLRSFRCVGDDEPWAVGPEAAITVSVPGWVRDGTADVWVAEDAGRVVGVIALTISESDNEVAVSQVLAVVSDRRREYIGYELKRTALAWFQAVGGRYVYSEVDARNSAMRECNSIFGAVEDAADEPGVLDVVVRIVE